MTDTQGSTALGPTATTPTPTPTPTAPPTSARRAVQAAHPALTLTGALSTVTGILIALGAAATTATGIMAGLHLGAPFTLYLAYASGAETVAVTLVHALSTQFGSGPSAAA